MPRDRRAKQVDRLLCWIASAISQRRIARVVLVGASVDAFEFASELGERVRAALHDRGVDRATSREVSRPDNALTQGKRYARESDA